jgi:hypothetical protein
MGYATIVNSLLISEDKMGYAGGSIVIEKMWNSVREYIPKDKRAKVLAEVMYDFACETDWDTEDEIKNVWEESEVAMKIYWEYFAQ